jgi:fatty acid-binding protein DegV
MGAKVLKLHPQIAMFDGQLKAKKKYSGNMRRSLTSYIRDLAEEYRSYDKTRCFVTHTISDQELVDLVIDLTKELFEFDVVLESVAGCTVTTHCGPNTIGLLFITE